VPNGAKQIVPAQLIYDISVRVISDTHTHNLEPIYHVSLSILHWPYSAVKACGAWHREMPYVYLNTLSDNQYPNTISAKLWADSNLRDEVTLMTIILTLISHITVDNP